MRLTSAAVLLLLAALAASAAAQRQRFCYKRVGYTRKRAERQLPPTDGPCQGDSCEQPAAATRYKTEVFYRTERHCCAGHQMAAQSPDWCTPVCSRGCPQGEACTAPDRCECVEGRRRDSQGRCVAIAASLLGRELRTLQAQLLSYIGSLLDGVKSLAKQEGGYGLGHASDSTPAALEANSTSRSAPAELSAAADQGLSFSSAPWTALLERWSGPAADLELQPPPAAAADVTAVTSQPAACPSSPAVTFDRGVTSPSRLPHRSCTRHRSNSPLPHSVPATRCSQVTTPPTYFSPKLITSKLRNFCHLSLQL